jgi:sugar phosphate isomerase/epimerase
VTKEPLLSLAAGVLPEFPPESIVAAAGAAGYPAAGIWFDPDSWSDSVTGRVRRALDTGHLMALDIEVIWIRDGRTVSNTARRLIATGGELGARNVLIVSANPDRAEAAHQFAALCELAEAAGMRAVLEFLMISQVRTLDAALAMVREVGHPAGGVLVDALHLQRCGATPEDLAAVEPELLPYAQLCDGPAVLPDTSQEAYLVDAVDGRLAPGEGELPLARLLHGLPAGTPLSLEVRSRRYRERFPDPEARARAVLDRTRRFLAAC